MIDLHCHILPGLDDGAENWEQSSAMAKVAVSDNVQIMVATPHTLNGQFTNSSENIQKHLVKLRKILKQKKVPLKVLPGSDTQVRGDMVDRIGRGDALTINNTGRYLLLEFPHQTLPHGYEQEIFNLKLNGITPVITHPERNLEILYHFDILYELIEMGCVMQVTAGSITGGFGKESMEFSHKMLRLRMAHVIASDAHSEQNRPPILSEAVVAAAKIMDDRSEAMNTVIKRPLAIIRGEPLLLPEPLVPEKKKWFHIFKKK